MHNPTQSIVIVGAGGFGAEFVWVATEMNLAAVRRGDGSVPWQILGYCDDQPAKLGRRIGTCEVHGNIAETARKFLHRRIGFAVAVGANSVRAVLAQAAEVEGWYPVTLIHPSAVIAADAHIGAGTYVGPGAVICPSARVGNHVVINTHASVGHDAVLEDYCQLCPGARVSGACRLDRYAFLGSNASLMPGISVGESAVVAANSHAVRNVAPRVTALGCPARALSAPLSATPKEAKHG